MMDFEDCTSALESIDPVQRPHQLWAWWDAGSIDRETLGLLIIRVWSHGNNDAEGRNTLGVARWRALWRAVGFISDDGTCRPLAPLTVWRGAKRHIAGVGLAWSRDDGIAERFAESDTLWTSGGDCALYRVTVAPESVLAIVTEPGENEVVVDPQSLIGVECVATCSLERNAHGSPEWRWVRLSDGFQRVHSDREQWVPVSQWPHPQQAT